MGLWGELGEPWGLESKWELSKYAKGKRDQCHL